MSKYEGLTVEAAIETGLQALSLTKDAVEIRVIEAGKKGFLGFGKKLAVVELTPKAVTSKATAETQAIEVQETVVKPAIAEAATLANTATTSLEDLSDDAAITELSVYLTNITKELDAPAVVKVDRQKNVVTFHLDGDKPGLLIGKHGKVLNALQYLSQVFVHRVAQNKLSVVVNVGNYRERREATLERLASNTADKVKRTGQPVFLEPMPAFERKQIHAILTNHPEVSTHSEGDEPFRYLVVSLKQR